LQLPATNPANQVRRAEGSNAITAWVDLHDQADQDFIILGEMNIQTVSELASAQPPNGSTGFVSPRRTLADNSELCKLVAFLAMFHVGVADG